jgi:hypothetical protein
MPVMCIPAICNRARVTLNQVIHHNAPPSILCEKGDCDCRKSIRYFFFASQPGMLRVHVQRIALQIALSGNWGT